MIHDIQVYHPSNLPFFAENISEILSKYDINSIITVSNYSKKDIEKYSIHQDKINVIYNGVSNSFKQLDEKKNK